MNVARQTEYDIQSRLIRALLTSMRNQATLKDVRLIETHISWVMLAGRYAYKIKKAVDLGFLSFVGLEARHHYCEEEIRLNRRLAPGIYLNVIAIGGSAENPLFGAQPAIEYAVRMRRFAVSKQLDRLVANHKILPRHMDRLAATIAEFHRNLPAAGVDSAFGTADAVRLAAEENFGQLQVLLTEQRDLDVLAALRRDSDNEYAACRSLFEQRLAQGYVRECHGDLHLGNIVLIDDQPVPFDGIEFNPALRWIDVMSEVAFTVMDMLHYQRAALAWRFLNAYLEATGDYAGIPLLRFYIAYRSMVRAKVGAIRASQLAQSSLIAAEAWAECRGYLDLAGRFFARRRAALIITHGLPGSGKTTFSQIALEKMQAIRVRSDVERKRLFGLDALADSRASGGKFLYSAEISQRTYARLKELARELLSAGYTVIVDAAFLKQQEREQFYRLAHELQVAFAIASIQASEAALRARIVQRHEAASDASEADIAVLEKLTHAQQPLSAEEKSMTASFINEGAGFAVDSVAWDSLYQQLGKDKSDVPGHT